MKLAIMQPYIFPYIGYFQLIKAVDRFVVYDDVSFIKQGWINRNSILVNGKSNLFTIQLENASSFININETKINTNFYAGWRDKFLKTITLNYSKAPFFKEAFEVVKYVLFSDSNTISSLAYLGLKSVCEYLDIETEFIETSVIYKNNYLHSQDRVMDICIKEKASEYINAAGGMSLYSKSEFKVKGLELNFIKAKNVEYKQFKNEFVPWLSIIDVMMFNSPTAINELLNQYELL